MVARMTFLNRNNDFQRVVHSPFIQRKLEDYTYELLPSLKMSPNNITGTAVLIIIVYSHL